MINQKEKILEDILLELRPYDEKFIDSLILIIYKTKNNNLIIEQVSKFIDKYISKIKDKDSLSKFNKIKDKIDKIKQFEKIEEDNNLIDDILKNL